MLSMNILPSAIQTHISTCGILHISTASILHSVTKANERYLDLRFEHLDLAYQ